MILYLKEGVTSNEVFNTPEVIFKELKDIGSIDQETFWIVCLNNNLNIISKVCIAMGGLNHCQCDPKIVFRRALQAGAASIVLVHNHPSDNIKESKQDVELTKRLMEGGKILDIKVLDHVIICKDSYKSLKESGLI